MSKPYRVEVFGKPGCDKCSVLKERTDKLLAKPEWQDFETAHHDMETVDGLIAFSEAECINPQRIPAFLVSRREESGDYQPVRSKKPGCRDDVCKGSHLHQYVGLQTDYTEAGKGVLSPKMITAVLQEARNG